MLLTGLKDKCKTCFLSVCEMGEQKGTLLFSSKINLKSTLKQQKI